MTPAAGAEGSVDIRLTVADGAVRAAAVAVRRPVGARALIGRTVPDALRLVPLLFAVCGTAQGAAAVEACERALGLPQDDARARARDLLVLAEIIDSHAWQALVEWPRLIGGTAQAQDLSRLRAATAAIRPALFPGRDALRLGGAPRPGAAAVELALIRVEAILDQAVLAGFPTDGGLAALHAWAAAEATPAARFMALALEEDIAGFGATDAHVLPDHPASWFAGRLDDDPGFSLAPTDDGRPAMVGPCARMAGHPLVRAVAERSGVGVAAHVTARLAELAGLVGRIRAGLSRLAPAEPAERSAQAFGTGTGTGMAETARGPLVHRVRIEQGRVADWRSVAPTEWNFHPQGPLARGLVGAPANGRLERRAGLLVAALDPCVAWTLAIGEAQTETA